MKIPRVEENCTDFMNERRNMKGEFLLLHLFLCLVVLPSHIYGGDIGLGNLAEIFAQLAGGDGCVFKCPGGPYIYCYIFCRTFLLIYIVIDLYCYFIAKVETSLK